MKKKAKWISILAVSAMLVGCAEEESKTESTEATEATDVAAEETNESEEHVHNHSHDEETEDIYAGYFKDEQVKDRELSDWAGDWQSVYPYLQDGTLDEVFEHKAEEDETQTAEDFEAYYEIGYKTETERIVIDGNQVTFYENGQAHPGEFEYDGYEILTYEKGNRGVRFIYKNTDNAEGVPAYIQFSDHIIAPEKSGHYHLYWGDDRAALLEEVENWPTYYPSSMDGHDIAHEMMAH